MPALKTINVDIHNVKVGDIISVDNDNTWPYGAEVGSIKLGTKWGVLRDRNGHMLRRVELDTTVNVERMMKTDAELAEERKLYRDKAAARMIDQMLTAHGEVAKHLIEVLQSGKTPTPDRVYTLYKAQRLHELGVTAQTMVDNGRTPAEALEGLSSVCVESLISGDYQPNYSGGFNGFNMERQARHDTNVEFIKSVKWTIG